MAANNVNTQNQFLLGNRDNTNQMKQRGFQDQMQKAGALSGAASQYGGYLDAERQGAIAGIGKGVGGVGDSILSWYGGGMGGL